MRRLDPQRWSPSLRSERGVSLIASLLILAFFSISASSALYFSRGAARHADFSSESEDAVNLGEAGMNLARATLWQAADPTDANAVPLEQVTMEGGTVEYWGTYDAGTQIWTLTGIATVPNPSGPGTVERAVESLVSVSTTPVSTWIWDYYLSKPTSCVTFENNLVFDFPVKIDGDLCLKNSAKITGDPVEVNGTVTLQNSSRIGELANPISLANIVGGCTGGSPDPHPCTSADRVYAASYTQVPFTNPVPTIDWTYWYDNASPGPKNYCTTGSFPGGFDDGALVMDGSLPDVDLTPGTSYDCKTASGRIAWDVATSTLTIDGVIFFDGNVVMEQNLTAFYQGRATIYARGTVKVKNNFQLCGVATCDEYWDSTQNAIVLVAYGPGSEAFAIENNAIYQGGAIVDGDYVLRNNAENHGPVVATNLALANSGDTFIPIVGGQPGLPSFGGQTLVPSVTLTNVPDTYRSYTP